MVKIKLELFESIVGAILLPNIGLVFTTIFLFISLIVGQNPTVYQWIVIFYVLCLILLIVAILTCLVVNWKSKREFIVHDNNSFEVFNRKYFILPLNERFIYQNTSAYKNGKSSPLKKGKELVFFIIIYKLRKRFFIN